ncbi:MAG: hypothetical protein NC299_07725 [Lachnospiraceae bacterium]|nr:hypothetical protein [Ruminococcus sp.]MCM1275243.1 hypothetical protein [Lachnospiraceae bacterium]
MKILFIGGDKRTEYAAKKLSAEYDVERFDEKTRGRFGAVVLPLPLTKNGADIFAPLSDSPLPFGVIAQYAENNAVILAGGECPALSEICAENGYTLVNYFAEEALTLKNAALTAEAACVMLSLSTEGALLGSRSLITGYGRIGRMLAYRLAANGSSVTIAARRTEQRTAAELDGFSAVGLPNIGCVLGDMDFIANTAPSALFTAEHFSAIKNSAVFIELATLPGQPSKALADARKIKYIYAPGLPGKHSPKAAGEAVAETVREKLTALYR